MTHIVPELLKHAKAAGVTVRKKGAGHYQILGKLLVNYWPHSEHQTAYIQGTTRGIRRVTPARAVELSLAPPPPGLISAIARRRNNRPHRRGLIAKGGGACHWCKAALTLDTSTIDHVIPLSRGGLDHPRNRVLACEPCNRRRGDAMPELEGSHV